MKTNLFILLITLLLFCFGCNKDKDKDKDNNSGNSPRAGEWTGVYGSGKYGLSFVVNKDGNIENFTLTAKVGEGCGVTVTGEATYTGTAKIESNDSILFNASINETSSGLNVTEKMKGKFDSDDAASGTFKESFSIITTNIFCFGSSSDIVWTAKKDCSLKPQQGESSSRFCN